MTDVRHVHPELMRATGLGHELDHRVSAKTLRDLVARDRFFAHIDLVALDHHRELLAHDRMHADRRIDRVGIQIEFAFAYRQVRFADRPPLELKRQPHLPSHLIGLLTTAARREPLVTATKIIAVPLHARRLHERGFNQASVIAAALSKQLKLPIDEVSLVRAGASEKYRAGLDPKGRRDTVAGAFVVSHPRLVEDETILLVDDVFTTGATVNACAEALKASDARNVFVLTIARGKS